MTDRTVTIPAQTLQEQITIVHHTPGLSVYVEVAAGTMQNMPVADSPNSMTPNYTLKSVFMPAQQAVQRYRVEGADYEELMSASPAWAPNKPVGVFRHDDLWHYIDKYRAMQP